MARNSSFAGENRIPYLRIRARSAAVVEWIFPLFLSFASSPLGVRKYVSSHPSSAAFRFIISAKSPHCPQRPQRSLRRNHCGIPASWNTGDLSGGTFPLFSHATLPPGIDAARSEIRTSVSGPAFSSARIQVMIFVVLAIGRTSVSFFPYRTRPVSPSSKTAASGVQKERICLRLRCRRFQRQADQPDSQAVFRIRIISGNCSRKKQERSQTELHNQGRTALSLHLFCRSGPFAGPRPCLLRNILILPHVSGLPMHIYHNICVCFLRLAAQFFLWYNEIC